jgi:hypothetical protein
MALTPEGTPYVESTDLVANYPAASLSLANRVDLVGVLPFADAAARTTAIPTPTDGQFTYLQDTNTPEFYNGSAFQALGSGKLLQVVSTFKADTFTSSSTSLVDVTGLTATITPSSATSTILVTVSLSLTTAAAGNASRAAILRGATVVGGGTAAGNRGSITFFNRLSTAGDAIGARSFTFLDNPATTSATVYKVQAATEDTLAIGYSYNSDNDVATGGRIGASITLMEVSA